MTRHATTGLGQVREVLNAQVADGRLPGYVAALRVRGRTEILAGGRTAIEPDAPALRQDALFRIASLSKPIGAALTLRLVERGVLGLDEPIARWLPEAAQPRVLVAPDAPLDRTVAAERPVTVRQLLAFTSGWGLVLEDTPLQRAMISRGVFPGPLPPALSPDEFVARVTGLPLAFQPGAGWAYDTGTDLLGVLLSRATGTPLPDLLAEHVTGPLGMSSTGFWAVQADRLTTAYVPGPDGLTVLDPPDGVFARPPRFPKLSGGLIATASDVLRFFCVMADGGGPVLGPASVRLMTTDALTDAQRRQGPPVLGPGESWALGTAVDVEAAAPWMAPGRWGWNGGTGTTARVDPQRGTVAVLLTQRAMGGPQDGFDDFWAAVATA